MHAVVLPSSFRLAAPAALTAPLLAGLLLASACLDGPPATAGCNTDSDCATGELCISGLCEEDTGQLGDGDGDGDAAGDGDGDAIGDGDGDGDALGDGDGDGDTLGDGDGDGDAEPTDGGSAADGGSAPDGGAIGDGDGDGDGDLPPDAPGFTLAEEGGTPGVTRSREVAITLDAAPAGARFWLSEDGAPPDDVGSWPDELPPVIRLSPGAGVKTLFLWAEVGGLVSPSASEATIELRQVSVGPGAQACQGPCDVDTSTGATLQSAVDNAPDGWGVGLYPGTYLGPVVVDRPGLLLEGATGDARDAVVVKPAATTLAVGLVRLLADGITVRALTLRGDAGINSGVNATLGAGYNDRTQGWTSGHLIERLWIEATGPAFSGINSTAHAIFPGSFSLVRNNVALGWWEELVDVTGSAGDPLFGTPPEYLEGTVVVHNTALLGECDDGVIDADFSTDVRVAHNVILSLNDEAGAAIDDDDTLGFVFDDNLIWPWANLGVPDAGNLRTDPGLARYDGLAVASGSPLLDAATPEADDGLLDVFGHPRVAGAAPDLGAIEHTVTVPALPAEVHLGPAPGACPRPGASACDFFPADELDDALGQAVRASRPGGRIVLHGPNARFRADGVVVDRTLQITLAPGLGVGDVVLFHTEDLFASNKHGMLAVTQAEDVAIEGLAFECKNGCSWGVWFDPGYMGTPSIASARRGLVDRVHLYAPEDDGTHIEGLASLSHDGALRNSLATGALETLASAELVTNVEIVGNTFYTTEPTAVVHGVQLGGADGVIVANNLFDARNATAPTSEYAARIDAVTGAMAIRHNGFFGFNWKDDPADRVDFLLGEDGNCMTGNTEVTTPPDLCEPGYPSYVSLAAGDLHLAADSWAVDQGDASYLRPGELDLDGDVRASPPDVGAFER